MWLKQNQSTLKEKIKILKEFDEKIIVALSESKEENADDSMAKEIEETDEVIAEKSQNKACIQHQRILLKLMPHLTTAKYRQTALVKS